MDVSLLPLLPKADDTVGDDSNCARIHLDQRCQLVRPFWGSLPASFSASRCPWLFAADLPKFEAGWLGGSSSRLPGRSGF